MMESEAPMFFALRHVWRFWTESWSAPGRARWLYTLFSLGFLGLAIGGIVKRDPTVIGLGIAFALVTIGLAIIAPKLSNLSGRDVGTDL